MSAMKAYQTTLDMEGDRLLAILRADLILLGRGHTESDLFRQNVAVNLRALADLIIQGSNPDPFPHFRHGEESQSAFIKAVADCKDKDELWDFVANHLDRVLPEGGEG